MKKSVRLFSAALGVVILLQVLCIAVSASSEIELYGRGVLSKMDNSEALLYAYDKIVDGVESSLSEISVYNGKNSISVNEINMVYDVYRRDHTEHFWLGNAYSYFQNSKTVTVLAPQYLYAGDELKEKKAEFEKAVDDILSGLNSSFTEFEKELYLHDTLAKRVVYVGDTNARNAYGALVEGRAVCEGYAEAFQYLLQRAGIQSFIIIGASINPSTQKPEGHAWNVVRVDGKYYHADLTWNDQSNCIYHSYFNLGDKDITTDHSITPTEYPLPVCDSDEAMYFKVKGGMVSSPTVEQIGDLFKNNATSTGVGLYVVGDVESFISWLKSNIGSIATYIGRQGLVSYRYSILGKEVFIGFDDCTHSLLSKVNAKAATCTSGGNTEYYVCTCGSWFADAKGENPISKQESVYTTALGHDYSEKCVDEAHLRDNGSCQKKASYWYDCSRCSANAKDDPTAESSFYETDKYGGHDFSSEVHEKDGEYFRKCTVDGCTETETTEKDDVSGATTDRSTAEGVEGFIGNVAGKIGCTSTVGGISLLPIALLTVLGTATALKRKKG